VRESAQLRVKVGPSSATSTRWAELGTLAKPVVLDFNCSASDRREVRLVVDEALRHVRVVAVEQPFAAGNVVDHAKLRAELDIPLSLDEGIRHRRDLDQVSRYGAADWVCIKPARVGGFAQARTLIALAREKGLAPYVGGFFETSLARQANRTLACHLVEMPSDVGPSDIGQVGLRRDHLGLGWVLGEGLMQSTPLATINL
jgi:L-alanine-DL-glutamate epimerase-like enolase superfamily enzyme